MNKKNKDLAMYIMTVAFCLLLVIDGIVFYVNHSLYMDYSFLKLIDYFYLNSFSSIIQFLFPLVAIILGCRNFHQKLHSGFIKNQIINSGYKKVILKEYFDSFKNPIIFLLIFFGTNIIVSMLVSKFNFQFISTSDFFVFFDGKATILNFLISYTFYIFNLILLSIIFVNIGLIFSKTNKNFWISAVISYLIIIVYTVASEIIIGPMIFVYIDDVFFRNGMHIMFSIWGYDNGVTPIKIMIYEFILLLITGISCFLTYRNKESVIIHAEK